MATRPPTNPVNHKKLLHSKWTATQPNGREKHFLVCAVEHDDAGTLIGCTLQAVHSGRERELPWRDLKNAGRWRMGWV